MSDHRSVPTEDELRATIEAYVHGSFSEGLDANELITAWPEGGYRAALKVHLAQERAHEQVSRRFPEPGSPRTDGRDGS